MRRKVNRVGNNTLTVSLPAKWANRYNIKQGDELEVNEQGSALVVGSKDDSKWGKTKVDVEKFGLFHQNFLANVYHVGYDEVEVLFRNSQDFENIQKRLPNFIGFEIVYQGEKSCVIKDISKTSELEFDNVLRRTFLMLIEMSERCSDAISKKEFDKLNEIRLLESMNNKFTDYCRRILNKYGYKDEKRTPVVYTLVHDLERLGDEYKRICDHFYKEKQPVNKDLLKLFQKINKYIRTYYELFYKYDRAKLEYLLNEGKTIVKSLQTFLTSKSASDAILAHHLIYITIGVYDLTYTYVEMFI
ncbi:AbrB/MazE/SpoVT family DNA-binding domain-containing protein [Candidatus Woesearchaeota archaeon]|nr:AbrB/MazE/SpoVT family DNA-binding domain-containing protein [Candidatus Woesearchaeota archaeon]